MNPKDKIRKTLHQHIAIFQAIEDRCLDAVVGIGETLIGALKSGKKLLIAGNGGSAADAQHFAAELIGRFESERPAVSAIALTTDTSILTAVSNDYGFSDIFVRQVTGLGKKGDVFLGISTSGNSQNVISAMEAAAKLGLHTIGLLGKNGGRMAALADECVIIPATNTARIQEAHQWVYHTWCTLIDSAGLSTITTQRGGK